MNSAYIASVINSTLRSTTPILLAALGCAMCSQVGVFNVALEAQMLIACFTSIAVDYYTSSVLLSVLAGVLSGAVVGAVVAVLQVKYKAADMVVGTALNLLVGAITTFLLYLLFGLRGKLVDNRLMSLTKINLPLIRDIPFIGRVLENLTIIDYLSYIIAVILFVYLYKTVAGFRTLSVGINKAAGGEPWHQGYPHSDGDGHSLRCIVRFGRRGAEHGTGDHVHGEHDLPDAALLPWRQPRWECPTRCWSLQPACFSDCARASVLPSRTL